MQPCLHRLRALWNQRLFRLLLVLGVIGALIGRLDLVVLRSVLAQFNIAYGVAMLGVNGLLVLLFALRWRSVARLLGISAPLPQFVRVIWLSACLSEFGPPLVVGELTRFHLMRAFGCNWRLLGSQLADRLSGYAILFVVVMLFSPRYAEWFNWQSTPGVVTFVVMLMAGMAAVPYWRLSRKPEKKHIASVILTVMRSPPHYLYSLLIQTLLCANLLLAAVGLGVAHKPHTLLMLAPLLLLGVSALPSVWSDWGKREATALLVLVPAGLCAEEALAVSLVFGLCHLITTLPGWLFLLQEQKIR